MLRLIGRNQAVEVSEYWKHWSQTIANWIRDGYQRWIFSHLPDDTYAPGLARMLHDMIRIEIPELPELPKLAPTPTMKQFRLFD